jgi:hypothetical protein
MKKFNAFMLTVMVPLFFTACNNDDKPVNEEEVITTVIATFVGGGQTITLTSRDLDGEGPNPPQLNQTGGNFTNGVTYTGFLTFLNELESPVEDITIEVEEEGDEHQVFFQTSSGLGVFTYTDVDVNGKPIGLNFTFITQNAGTGQLNITLKHKPNKNAPGVTDGNIANAGGETDAEVSFEVVVQ